MNGANDRTTREAATHSRRRKGTAWKSGLVVTGLGAVVLGAGYLAGVNAPAVAQSSTPQAVAQTGASRLTAEENQLQTPEVNRSSDAGVFLGFDEDGNAVFLGNNGALESRDDDHFESQNRLPQQFGGNAGRQPGGLAQQQPNFSRPLTRSRGS